MLTENRLGKDSANTHNILLNIQSSHAQTNLQNAKQVQTLMQTGISTYAFTKKEFERRLINQVVREYQTYQSQPRPQVPTWPPLEERCGLRMQIREQCRGSSDIKARDDCIFRHH